MCSKATTARRPAAQASSRARLELRAAGARLWPDPPDRAGRRPAGAGHSRLPRHRPDHAGAAQGAGRGRVASARLGDGLEPRASQADTLDRLKERLDRIGPDEPMLVVGWSLGGLFARELARAFPDRVQAVITLGSPFSGDLHQNNIWQALRADCGAQGRRAADPADHRQAAGAASRFMVVRGRDCRPARGARARP